MKKTWVEKIKDKDNLPKILKLEKRFPRYNGVHKMGAKVGDKVILVNPSEVIPIMTKVTKGKLITIHEICKKIAKKHKVKGCCSLTTGIFIMSIANAVEEVIAKGDRSSISKVPYWRTLKADGFLNDKYPGGAKYQKRLLKKEGFKVITRGKKYQVQDFETYLVSV